MEKINRYLNVCGIILVLVMNGLAEYLPLGGRTTGEISAMFPVKITPAPYAFGIWGLIYGLLVLFVIAQFLPSVKRSPEAQGIGPWFWISCLFNAGWVVAWHYLKITASFFIMLGLLASLVAVYLGSRPDGWAQNRVVRWLVQVPFSVYLGWIMAAILVNFRVASYNGGWFQAGWSDTAWTLLLIAVAVLIAMIVGRRWSDPFYMLVIVWALVAIGVANKDQPLLAWTCWGSAAFVLAMSYVFQRAPAVKAR